MKAKKWLATTVALVMLGGVAAGCSTAKPAETTTPGKSSKPQELILNMNGEIPTIDPGLAKDSQSSWVLDHTYEGLYFTDKDGQLKPGQAKDYKVSDDGLTYTFTLKDGLKWSNGDPVTAQDFEFAWKRVLDPALASEYAYQIADYIVGGHELNSAKKDASPAEIQKLKDAVGVKAKDDKTLEVKLLSPTPYFLQLTSFYTYYPVPKKVVEANKDWAADAKTAVSNGPFKASEWEHDKKFSIAKNDNYWNKDSITLDKVTWLVIPDDNTAWQMYENGELNAEHVPPTTATEKALKSGEAKAEPELATYFYRFNVTKPPFNNEKVRKAFAMSINRQAIIDNVTKAFQKPAFAFVSPGIKMPSGKDFRDINGNEFFKEDNAEAKKLLDEGLKELGMTSMPKVTLSYNTSEGHKVIAEAVQEMWKKNLGVEVQLENSEWKVYLDKVHKLDYQIARAGWVGDYADPMTFIDMFVTKGDNNETGWSNPQYDELVKKAKAEKDTAAREKQLSDAEKILMKEMPIAPVYYYTKVIAYKPEVKGAYKPVNREPIFRYVTVGK